LLTIQKIEIRALALSAARPLFRAELNGFHQRRQPKIRISAGSMLNTLAR
jgi:hypothetical protein